MSRYSIFSLLRNGMSYHENWNASGKAWSQSRNTTW
jgi:hypothetical protein